MYNNKIFIKNNIYKFCLLTIPVAKIPISKYLAIYVYSPLNMALTLS